MKKKMKSGTKENLKNIFGSLISNQRAIDGARHNRWWVALIMFVISVIIPVIPIAVTNATLYGTSFFSNGMKSFDSTITAFTLEMQDKNIELQIDDKHVLVDEGEKWKTTYTEATDGVQYHYTNSNSGQYDLLVYYVSTIYDSAFNNLAGEIASRQYIVGTTTRYTVSSSEASSSEVPSLYTPAIIVFGAERVVAYIYNPNSTTLYGSISGDYLNTEVGTILSEFGKIDGIVANPNDTEDVKIVTKHWTDFFDETYITFRNQNAIFQTFLSLGVYIVLGAFMGLMIFLLTRGKKNIFHIYTFGDCEKISAWSMVSPAILSLILGFIFKDYAVMFFIILLGVRVMWLSMKQLKPVNR